MSTSKLRCRNPFRRPAALLAVAALLAMPIAAAAAPTDAVDAAWTWSWDGLAERVASWLGWTGPDAGRATGASDLGSTLDPDGNSAAPTAPSGFTLAPDDDSSALGSTLDPDG